MRHRRRKKLLPLLGAGALLVAGVTAGITGAAQAGSTTGGATTECAASWYGASDEHVEGAPTASGEPFHAARMTAASRDLPFGTVVKVTNKADGRTATVKINDRGPFTDPEHRCLDLSAGAFFALGQDLCSGTTDVTATVMPPGTKTSRPDPDFEPVSMSDCPPGSGLRG